MSGEAYQRAFDTKGFPVSSECACSMLVSAVAILCFVGAPQEADAVGLTLAIFRSPSCAHCESVEPAALEKLGGKLGCKIELKIYDIDDIENYKLLLKVEKALGDEDNEFPIVVVGDKLLAENAEIVKGLEQAVRDAIAAGQVGAARGRNAAAFWRVPANGDVGNAYVRPLPGYDPCQVRGKGKKGGTFPLTLQQGGGSCSVGSWKTRHSPTRMLQVVPAGFERPEWGKRTYETRHPDNAGERDDGASACLPTDICGANSCNGKNGDAIAATDHESNAVR